MLLKIFKNRTVSSSGTWGTKNENNYEILNFEFPEELEEYNKRIVYYLGNQKVWDAIIDNKAILTNAITTKGSVKAYIWCTKSDDAFETDVDFRTQIFVMNFFENDNADGIVPTPEQVDGFNTMLTAMNEKIEEIDELETTIENAETQRQENEETRQENESTRQENEQTRQEQEAERERRTDEAIGNIEDKTAEYNQNAEAKTNEFNQNATQKTNDFNSNYTQKVNDFNANASSKTSDFNSNAETKTNTFNTNATNKTNAFNSNATEKTTAFNDNASTKTSAFNDNATQKTTNFDNNASEKTDEFNTNAQEKIDEYDEHIVEYQAQIDELQEEVEELSENMPWGETEQATEIDITDAAKYSKNKLELFGNTEQAQYTGKNLLSYPYTESSKTKNGITFTDNGDGSITINGTAQGNSSFTLFGSAYPEMQENFSGNYILGKNCSNLILCRAMYADKQESGAVIYRIVGQSTGTSAQMNTTQYPKGYVEIIVLNGTTVDNVTIYPMITDTQDNDYEPYTGGQPSPSPDYPQDIRVVTGENDIYWTSNENKLDLNKNYIKGGINGDTGAINTTTNPTITLGNNSISVYTSSAWDGYISDYYDCQSKDKINLSFEATTNFFWVGIAEYNADKQFIKSTALSNTETRKLNITTTSETKYIRLIFEGSRSRDSIDFSNINFVFQNHVILNLGSIELCKIRDYQDYLYRENGNWYVFKRITKMVLNGTESWKRVSSSTNPRFTFQIRGASVYGYSNYFTYILVQAAMTNHSIGLGSSTLSIRYDELADVQELKTWLASHNTVLYYILLTPTSTIITDETLIAQLDAIYEHLQLVKGTNNITVTAEDLKPYMELSYMQDLPSKLDNLDSRLSLLE